MANQNQSEIGQSDRRRLKNGMYAYAMGDGYRNQDLQRKLQQANKKVQAEDDTYSTGDECDYRAGDDRLIYKPPPLPPHSQQYFQPNPRCDFRVPGDVPYVERIPHNCWKYPFPPKQELKPRPSAPSKATPQFEMLKEKFLRNNNISEKLPDVSAQDKNEFIKECCEDAYNKGYVEKNAKGEHILKPQFRARHGQDSDHSDMTYTNHRGCDMFSPTDQFSDQESSEEKVKIPLTSNQRPNTFTKPSARSNGTTRSKKAEELVSLQKLKCDIIEVIQDGIQKIEKNTCEKPSTESQSHPQSTTSITNQNPDFFQSDVWATFVKQLRDNHLGNILHEVKNLHFLESLPERCQSDLNKKREL